MKKSGSYLAIANCDLLLRKYTEREYAKMDTLFILAELFDREYKNNQGKINQFSDSRRLTRQDSEMIVDYPKLHFVGQTNRVWI